MRKSKTTGEVIKATGLRPDGLNTVEQLDLLESMVDSNREMRLDSTKATLAHTNTKELINGMGTTFGGNSRAFHKIIKECMEVYYSTPVVRNIIDLMVDFASEGVQITHKVDAYQRIFDNWAQKSGFYKTIVNVFHSILLCGNCAILRLEGSIDPATKTELTKAEYLKKEKPEKNFIPVGYTILDPLRIEIETSNLFGDRLVYYNLTDADVLKIQDPQTQDDKDYVNALPDSFVKEALSKKRVKLDSSKLIMLHYKKLDWQNWAFPLIFSAIDDVNFKKMLRQMDESSAADVIKAIVIFKLGASVEGIPPDKARFQKFASLLKDTSAAKNIVWDDLIDIKDSFPPIEKILGAEKYQVVDIDILSNFGVSQVLVNGQGQGYSNSFLSVRTLQEKLETIRTDVLMHFIVPELERLVTALDLGSMPSTRFSSMSLRDEVAEKKLIIDLVDRNIVSPETALETFELDAEIESIRMNRKRQKFRDVVSPLDQPPAAPGVGSPKGGKGGRPLNSKKPQSKKRSTKPKGISLGDKFLEVMGFIDDNFDIDSTKELVQITALVFEGIKEYQIEYLTTDIIKEEMKSALVTENTLFHKINWDTTTPLKRVYQELLGV